MKQISILFLLLNSFLINAQEIRQFTENFTRFSTIKDGELGIIQKGNVTIIFNYGENNNIKIYFANGNNKTYYRVSEVEKGNTKDRIEFQYMKLLDEKGEEYYFVKYEDGEVKLLYLDSFTYTGGYGIALLP
ncbi:hypothetical protein ETU08_08250 [Apibacter muscae]|uniref:hypothetical protein n=1 Tax=Apibacter muscae TaxID=2509004 RepID=UPI0011AE0287|nr:hypothetical protein [Apibacter muscae]TWP28826.1 hypothetical protein ETU08_08250 [Apibacter muscae]